ncbi:MAG: DUF1579 domain-containing protein [Proteobacteria bacterium]|nr:MAG: DUF1579 domain-containing protein [Pseudomonadota bacterium]
MRSAIAPRLRAGHDAMKVWVGRWRADGHSHTPDGARGPWRSVESFEMLPGGFFILQRWHEHGQDERFEGISILAYDPKVDEYRSLNFENHGYERNYLVKRNGRQWKFDGDTERALYDFDRAGRRVEIRWEARAAPDQPWRPLCDRIAMRID